MYFAFALNHLIGLFHIVYQNRKKSAMVFRIPITIHGVPEKFLIVCETGQETIEWLCRTAYNRYNDRYTDTHHPYCFFARRLTDRSMLSMNDSVEKVLKDNESVEIGRIFEKKSIEEMKIFYLDVGMRLDDELISTST